MAKHNKRTQQRINLYVIHQRIMDSINLLIRDKSSKFQSTIEEIIGCDRTTLMNHLKSQFYFGMTFDNKRLKHGWHLDHITPISKMNDINGLITLNHYTNLQPLWAEDNLLKNAKNKRTIQKQQQNRNYSIYHRRTN